MLDNYNSAGLPAEFTEINTESSGRIDEIPTNSAVQTAELQADDEIRQLQLTNLPDFPVVAFLSISFTHHTAILSQVKSYEERKFYLYHGVGSLLCKAAERSACDHFLG